jgi:all-trans-retinol dehydrogenase (NAD+)
MVLFLFIAAILFVVWSGYFFMAYRVRSVAGKVVLITGGGHGIGRLMALRFSKLGAKVVLWDLNQELLAKVEEEIITSGGKVSTNVVDVANRELVYKTARAVGRVDILINNAGIVTGKTVLESPDALMEKTVQVNTIAHFWTIKAFLPGMIERSDGHIVTISSAASLSGVPGLLDYCASKFGAYGTAESLYMEIRKKKWNVKTLVVCPFYINTGMFAGAKSKIPWLLDIQDQNYVADRIVLAIRRGEERLYFPWFLTLVPMLRVLPMPWQAWIAEIIGTADSMDDFVGHAGGPKSPSKKCD